MAATLLGFSGRVAWRLRLHECRYMYEDSDDDDFGGIEGGAMEE